MIRKVTKVPNYVWFSLERFGNTIVSKKDVKSLGGKQKFLNMLKDKGYNCDLFEPSVQITHTGEAAYVRAVEHWVVREVKR